jgi:hypothetical protein
MVNIKGLIATGPPQAPSYLLILRIVALVLSLACFIAGCYNVSVTQYFFLDTAGALAIFSGIWIWAVIGADIAFTMLLKAFYFRIGFLIGYALSIIFWLCAWAVGASYASDTLGIDNTFYRKFGGSAAAIAAIGAVLWCVSAVYFFVC